MQVGDARQLVRLVRQGGGEVGQVGAVARNLKSGMEHASAAVRADADQRIAVVERLRVAPLLQLDDDVRRLAGAWMATGQHDIRTLAGERELVLQDHFDVDQAGINKVGPQPREAARPGAPLSRRCAGSGAHG